MRPLYFAGFCAVAILIASTAEAIPSRDPHSHGPGTITWSQNPIPPNNPDATNHQHNSTLDLRLNGSYDAYAVWDSELITDGPRDAWRLPVGQDPPPAGPAYAFGHGFIADDFISAIEYSFVGAGWNADNMQLVRDAFAEWETQAKTRANGSVVGQGGALIRRPGTTVGINFDEDTLFTQTNFEIRWTALNVATRAAEWQFDDSPYDPTPNDLELAFNTAVLYNNAGTNNAWNSNPEGNEWDFYSVALHEIGHVLGLDHLDVGNGTNLMAVGPNSFDVGDLHRFIDTADLQGALDLYSIPEPSTLALAVLGVVGLVGYSSRRKRG